MILVISSKKVYAASRLKQEAIIRNQKLRIMDTQELAACNFKIDIKNFNVLYVRDPYLNGSPKYIPQIIKLAKKFKAAGKRVIDSIIADGVLGQGKWVDYKKLKKAGLLIPNTRVSSHFSLRTSHYPLVLKWIYGFKAKNVFLIKSEKECNQVISDFAKASPDAGYKDNKSWAKEWLVQEYVDADFEFEVYVVGFKAVPVVLEYKIKDGFKADVKKSSVIRNEKDHPGYNRLLKIAGRAAKVLGRELCKVDILERGGKFYILEVNRNPGLVSFESLIGYNMASEFIDYLISPAVSPPSTAVRGSEEPSGSRTGGARGG